MIVSFSPGGRSCFVYCPPGYENTELRYPVIYACGEQADKMPPILEKLESRFQKGLSPFLLVGVDANWEQDLTPWPAPAAFRGSPDFTGGAGQYCQDIATQIKPLADQRFRTLSDPAHTAICGYSLGGLAALYALYLQPEFGLAASISGSLWYEGWVPFMEKESACIPSCAGIPLLRAR